MRRRYNKLITDRERLEEEVKLRTRDLEKKNLQIEQLDRMKTNFFTEISHELRTPLSLIMGPIDNLITNSENIESTKRIALMEMIKRNSSRLLNLINQLLDIARIDSGKMKIALSESDLLKTLRILLNEFLSTAESRKINYQIDIPEGSYITLFDRDKVEKIVINLLSNAFKFTAAQGTIACKIEIEEPSNKDNGSPPVLSVQVKDTGVGISRENLDRVFDRFYRVEGEWERDGMGTGIGLSVTEEFVKLLHGRIDVISEKDVGSLFKVRLPLGLTHLSDDEYVIVNQFPGPYGTNTVLNNQFFDDQNETGLSDKKSHLLIVEDNDDLRGFIRDSLSQDHKIYEAPDGITGLKIALSKIPDLVIADIIVPNINGLDLCKKLKNDERTSHIPVIILTAKATQDNRIEGLTAGADDYLSKPFDMNELKVRISNLLKQRAKLRLKYGSFAEFPGISETEGNSVDDLFMKKVNSIIIENLKYFDFDVGALQEKLGMSRISLYRKLKALTDQTPSAMIINHRMKAAARMLDEKKSNITEISLSVGYSNPSYFTKSFKDFFGVTPKEFISRAEKQGKIDQEN
jgi:signal transduction histidine kinase/AraC-like DNA-binding protein